MGCCIKKINRLQAVEILGRIIGYAGTPLVPDDISSISWSAYTLEPATGEETVVLEDVGLTPTSDYLETTLLLNAKWKEDNVGYNFHLNLDGSVFEERGKHYLIRVSFVPMDVDLPELIGVWLYEVV